MTSISIVVPVYNSSKYLQLCLDSLTSQTLEDIEIICVDDGSTDDSVNILKEYCNRDPRFVLITHEKNMGLLKTRGDGVRIAKSRYIMFCDADDSYLPETCQDLATMMDGTHADMIQFGSNIDAAPNVDKKLINFFEKFLRPCTEKLMNEKVFEGQFEGKFTWHIWNKIYSADLCKKAYLAAGEKKLIFSDDLFVSFFITYYSKHCEGTPNKYYNYHLGYGYTGSSTSNYSRLNVACENSWFIYDCIDFLKKENKYEIYKKYCFRDPLLQLGFCMSIWDELDDPQLRNKGRDILIKHWDNKYFHDSLYQFIDTHKEYSKNIEKDQPLNEETHELRKTPSNKPIFSVNSNEKGLDEVNQIINLISDPNIDVISFDVFDTLLIRPCIEPLDVLKLMPDLGGFTFSEFSEMHKYADMRSNEINGSRANIDDIYKIMGQTFSIDTKEIDRLKQLELETEYNTISSRKTVKAIYDAALKFGKTVIIATDTYFSKKIIKKMLWKEGYISFTKYYVSSDLGKRKDFGDMYDYILQDLKIHPSRIIHIGDNTLSDWSIPYSKGINVINYSKNSDRLKDSKLEKYIPHLHKEAGNSITLGIYANMRYNLQNRPWKPLWTDSYGLGLFMGQYVLNFTKWLVGIIKQQSCKKLLLCYRDGYIIEKALSILNKYVKLGFEIEEIHLPRHLRHSFYSEKGGLLKSLTDMGISKSMTVDEFITHRMYVTDSKLRSQAFELFKKCGYESKSEPVLNYGKIYPVIAKLNDIYKESTKKYNEVVRGYVLSKINNESTIIFDVGYRASISRFCSEFLNIQIPEIQMFANTGINYVDCNNPVFSYISYPTEVATDCGILEIMFENIISSQEPELTGIGYSLSKNEYYYKFGSYSKGNRIIDDVQQGICDYIDYAMSILRERIFNLKNDPYFEWNVIVDYLKNPDLESAGIIAKLYRPDSSQIKGIKNDDQFGGWLYIHSTRKNK